MPLIGASGRSGCFNPRPLRSERAATNRHRDSKASFNPPLRKGERPGRRGGGPAVFQSHAPPKRRRRALLPPVGIPTRVSIHAPERGRLLRDKSSALWPAVSIHAPVRGERRRTGEALMGANRVSTTPPRKGRRRMSGTGWRTTGVSIHAPEKEGASS